MDKQGQEDEFTMQLVVQELKERGYNDEQISFFIKNRTLEFKLALAGGAG